MCVFLRTIILCWDKIDHIIYLVYVGHGFISLESAQTPGHYIGVNHDGNCKAYLNGGITDDEKFYVIPVQPVSH